jgi:hypothetical protein
MNYFDAPNCPFTRWENFKFFLRHPLAYHCWRKQKITGYRWVGAL